MKNKTFAVWLTFFGGPIGLHRFYLKGFTDVLGWLLPIPTLLGWHGIQRAFELGQDDVISWLLIPLLGFTIAGCALNAIIYGLMATESEPSSPSGQTNWLTVFGVASSLLLGTTVLMASIVFSFQRYFESQIEQAKAISQGTEKAKP
jgi:hypothetical protein